MLCPRTLTRETIDLMFKTLKRSLSRAILGEPIKDWGVVFEQKPGFFKEQIRLGLYEKDKRSVLCLTYKYTSRISLNMMSFAIPVHDLGVFVATLQSNYERLREMVGSSRSSDVDKADKLPLAQRLIIKLIHGISASKLLLDHRDPATNQTEFRFYGYVTRKSETKILIQSDMDISQAEGHVISGKGLEAVLGVLSEHLESAGHQKTPWRHGTPSLAKTAALGGAGSRLRRQGR